jgi:hypothetical protein
MDVAAACHPGRTNVVHVGGSEQRLARVNDKKAFVRLAFIEISGWEVWVSDIGGVAGPEVVREKYSDVATAAALGHSSCSESTRFILSLIIYKSVWENIDEIIRLVTGKHRTLATILVLGGHIDKSWEFGMMSPSS